MFSCCIESLEYKHVTVNLSRVCLVPYNSRMSNQQSKYTDFRLLHESGKAFIIPNPWDIGSARILASLGFEALATTSSGMAHSLGLRDGQVSKQQTLAHCRSIVEATKLPVSADLEKGFGDSPMDVSNTISEAGAIGLAGCSIEDHTGMKENPIFNFNLAVERIHAAVESKQALANDFILTARCENLLWERKDLDDTIKRLQAFEQAGADVLFAPGLTDLQQIKTVCESVTKPVNIVIETVNSSVTLEALSELGVKRVSVGSKLALTAYGSFINAAKEMIDSGSFMNLANAAEFSELENYFD